jgi:hypothetical protein
MRKYLPTISELIDRLSIVTLKSIKLSENKEAYEKEAQEIISDISEILKEKKIKNFGQFIRAVQVNAISNEIIWQNEFKARQGGTEQDSLLKFTHSVNGVRNLAKNVISNELGERIDLKTDCLAADICRTKGYNFEGIL